LAERILATSDDDLATVVADLLTSDEIDALVARFKAVKQYIQTLSSKGRLLNPGEWTAATAGTQETERAGYFGPLKSGARKQ
jgi:Trp operon repressor